MAPPGSRHEKLASVASNQGRRLHPPKWNQSLKGQVAVNFISVEVGSETVLVTYSTMV
jgi:hypothetical protein